MPVQKAAVTSLLDLSSQLANSVQLPQQTRNLVILLSTPLSETKLEIHFLHNNYYQMCTHTSKQRYAILDYEYYCVSFRSFKNLLSEQLTGSVKWYAK
jgi:hypothetical protein